MNYDFPQDVVDAFMDSPTHRANLLRPQFRDLGVGVAFSATDDVYITQDFGALRNRRRHRSRQAALASGIAAPGTHQPALPLLHPAL